MGGAGVKRKMKAKGGFISGFEICSVPVTAIIATGLCPQRVGLIRGVGQKMERETRTFFLLLSHISYP